MKNKLAFLLVVMLVSVGLLVLVGNAVAGMETYTKAAPEEEWNNHVDNRVSSNGSSNTIYVPDDYSTIQAAVNAASAGETIIVREGTYNENVNVNKRLTIKSENGSAVTIVQAKNPDDHVFEVTGDYVIISGFTVENATGYFKAGIYLENVEHCNISDNNASNNYIGIHLVYSSNYNTLTKNTANSNNYYGIHLYSSSNNNTLTSNTASNNYIGISLYSSSNNKIYLNNFIKNTDNVYSDEDSTNIWNSTEKITYPYNGSEFENYLGNYWDDYTDIDVDNDGIWDNSRPIDSDKDYHPLVEPFENYEEKWSFAIITDLQIGRGYPDYGGKGVDIEDQKVEGQDYYLTERLKKAVEWINDNKTKCNIKFVIVLGDISDSGEYSELNKSKNILDGLDVPYVPVIGNHEIWAYTDDEENESARFFEDVFGEQFEKLENNPDFNFYWQSDRGELVNYNFTYNGMNFVVLDCVTRDHALIGYGVNPYAELFPETLEWLTDCLNEHKGEPAIIVSHHPMTDDSIKAFDDEDLQKICKIINDSKCDVLNFAGHIHGSGITRGGDWGHLWHNYFMDANREYVHKDDSTGLLLHSLTT